MSKNFDIVCDFYNDEERKLFNQYIKYENSDNNWIFLYKSDKITNYEMIKGFIHSCDQKLAKDKDYNGVWERLFSNVHFSTDSLVSVLSMMTYSSPVILQAYVTRNKRDPEDHISYRIIAITILKTMKPFNKVINDFQPEDVGGYMFYVTPLKTQEELDNVKANYESYILSQFEKYVNTFTDEDLGEISIEQNWICLQMDENVTLLRKSRLKDSNNEYPGSGYPVYETSCCSYELKGFWNRFKLCCIKFFRWLTFNDDLYTKISDVKDVPYLQQS